MSPAQDAGEAGSKLPALQYRVQRRSGGSRQHQKCKPHALSACHRERRCSCASRHERWAVPGTALFPRSDAVRRKALPDRRLASWLEVVAVRPAIGRKGWSHHVLATTKISAACCRPEAHPTAALGRQFSLRSRKQTFDRCSEGLRREASASHL